MNQPDRLLQLYDVIRNLVTEFIRFTQHVPSLFISALRGVPKSRTGRLIRFNETKVQNTSQLSAKGKNVPEGTGRQSSELTTKPVGNVFVGTDDRSEMEKIDCEQTVGTRS